MRTIGLVLALAALAASQSSPPAKEAPRTRAEATDYVETSRHADVLAFLEALKGLPHADRLRFESMGVSGEDRPMPLVIAADPQRKAGVPLRILVNANIHAGEVEGKESVQMLLREIALGRHSGILAHADVLFVPNFNPDGNDRIDKRNRVRQNGPDGGVGTRANAQSLDLNRDFLKLESPECRNLVAVFNRYDPHYFLDLHTTNGSPHGYHLTYAPSLSTNVSGGIDHFMFDVLMPEVTRAMLSNHDYRCFHYGNFGRGKQKSWNTYDHRPRFGTNYYGLRNRLSVVVEAYSYLDFETRVLVTNAFVIENLKAAVRHADAIRAACEAADIEANAATWRFGHRTSLAAGRTGEILVGSWRRVELPGDLGFRLAANPEHRPEKMPIRVSFRSSERLAAPAAWAIVGASDAVLSNLLAHGLVVERVTKSFETTVEAFVPVSVKKARRPFQGHRTVTLEGAFDRRKGTVPEGALLVRAEQRLSRVAAQLLEAVSEDSLATWNFFDDVTEVAAGGSAGSYPVLRLVELPDVTTEPVTR